LAAVAEIALTVSEADVVFATMAVPLLDVAEIVVPDVVFATTAVPPLAVAEIALGPDVV
jgi:hypothetical protein